MAVGGHLNVGSGDINSQTVYALHTTGDIAATGNIVAYISSDERLKENIIPIRKGVDLIQKMNPVEFDWNEKGVQFGWGLRKVQEGGTRDLGFIAQELEEVLPEVVGTVENKEKEEYLGVQYEKIVPVLVKAVQEQQEEIDELKELVKKLTKDK